MRKRHPWFWIIILILVTFACVFYMAGDQILLFAFPKAVLAAALTDTCTQLETQFQYSLLTIAGKYIDPEWNYSAVGTFEISNDILGPVQSDFYLQLNGRKHQITADGTLGTSSANLDISLYADDIFFAVNANDLTKDKFYGITYKTFLEDIEKIPLIHYFIPKTTLSDWNRSIQKIQSGMAGNFPEFTVINADKKDMEQFQLAILALPCKFEQRILTIDGVVKKCQVLTYTITENLLKTHFPDTTQLGSLDASFYLFDNKLAKIYIKSENNGVSNEIFFDFHQTLSDKIISVHFIDGAANNSWTVTSEMEKSSGIFTEKWTWSNTNSRNPIKCVLLSQYDLITKTWQLALDDSKGSINIALCETESGLQIHTDQFEEVLRRIVKAELPKSFSKIKCCMTMIPGSGIGIPEYVNLDEWSMEDLWNIISNVGSLSGSKHLP